MDIQMSFKPIDNKIFDEVDIVLSQTIKKLNETQKTSIKHTLMNYKMNQDNIEIGLKSLIQELKTISEETEPEQTPRPIQTTQPKPITQQKSIPKEAEPEIIEL